MKLQQPRRTGLAGCVGRLRYGGAGLKNNNNEVSNVYLLNIRVTTIPYNADANIENRLKQRERDRQKAEDAKKAEQKAKENAARKAAEQKARDNAAKQQRSQMSGSSSSYKSSGSSGTSSSYKPSGSSNSSSSYKPSSSGSSSSNAGKSAGSAASLTKQQQAQQNLDKAWGDFGNALAGIAQQNAANQAEREAAERAKREELAWLEREAEAERRREAVEHAAYVADMHRALANDFTDGRIPLSTDNITAPELWYFVWKGDGARVTVSNVFPITCYGDGSYPFKNSVVSEIGAGTVTIVGWFYSRGEAEQALERFLQTTREGEMPVNEFAYKSKPRTATVARQGDGDFWGTEPAKTAKPGKENTPKTGSDFWD